MFSMAILIALLYKHLLNEMVDFHSISDFYFYQ